MDRRYNQAVNVLPSPTGSIEAQIPDTCLDNLKQLLDHYPNGIPSLKLEREYSNLFKSKLPIQEWGYENLSHMLQLNSDIFLFKKVDDESLEKYPEHADDFLVFQVIDSNNSARAQDIDYDLKVKLARLILKFSAEKKIFPIYKWIEFYREEYNVPNFTFDLVDHVTLFKLITKEFPIELYLSDEPPSSTNNITNSEPIEPNKHQAQTLIISDTVEGQKQDDNSAVDNGAIGAINSLDSETVDEQVNAMSNKVDNTFAMDVVMEPDETEAFHCSADNTHASELTMTDETSERGIRLDHPWVNLDDTVPPLVIHESDGEETVKAQTREKFQETTMSVNQKICARAKSQNRILSWRARMVKEGKHQLVLDLCLRADKLPPDVCKPGDNYIPMSLELLDKVNPGANIQEVIIVASSNPNHIFINMMQSGKQLRALGKEMSEYFLTHDQSSYIVPQDLLYEGFPCLFQSYDDRMKEKLWERSKIHKCDSKKATIESVDYGGFKTVDISEIYLLPKKWTSLPAQAIHVSMVGVKPKGGVVRWSSDVNQRISDFSWYEYGLDCFFLNKKKNTQQVSYEALLCDRHDPEINLFLDQVLTLEGLADPDTSRSQEVEQWRNLMVSTYSS